MRIIARLILAALLLLPFAAHANTTNSIWFQCRKDSDCVAVKTLCNHWQGVNKKYTKAYKAAVSPAYPNACPAMTPGEKQNTKHIKAKCVDMMCAINIPNTTP